MKLGYEERFEKIERDIEEIKAILRDFSRTIEGLFDLIDYLEADLGLVTVNKKGYDWLSKFVV